jgi:hypothetical protein
VILQAMAIASTVATDDDGHRHWSLTLEGIQVLW